MTELNWHWVEPYDDDPADYEYLDFIQRGGQD